MRPVLGVAVDDGEVSAVLVDADVPQLGPFDSQRWAAEPDVSQADAVARAVTSMAERAENASLTVGAIGLVALPSGDADTAAVTEAVRAVSDAPALVVPLDDARIAYLAGAPELADTPVLALHTRTGGVESASIVDTGSRTVLSSVVRGDDPLTGHTDALPDTMDEAVARAGVAPAALVFLDLRPGDAPPARELATILGVPFVTPHGVPWHRATGAALVAARRNRAQPVAAGAGSPRRNVALLAVVVALVAMLGGGLALAMGASGGGSEDQDGPAGQSEVSDSTEFAPETDTPELWDRIAPHPVPRDAGTPDDADTPPDDADTPQHPAPQDPASQGVDPCGAALPASWPARGSDPAPSPAPEHAPELAPPCDPPANPAP